MMTVVVQNLNNWGRVKGKSKPTEIVSIFWLLLVSGTVIEKTGAPSPQFPPQFLLYSDSLTPAI
jgi:hypothetical protein